MFPSALDQEADSLKLIGHQVGNYLKRKQDLFLDSVCGWYKGADWYEEVWKLSTASQRVLNEEQALQRHLLRQTIIESEVVSSNVYTRSRTKVVVSYLGYQRVRTLNRENIMKSGVSALGDSSHLQRRQHRIALIQSSGQVACDLEIEYDWEHVIAFAEAGVVQPIGQSPNVESGCRIDCAAWCRGRIACTGERTR